MPISHDGHVAPFRVGLAGVGEEGEGGEEADQTGASADTVCLEPVHVNMVFHFSLSSILNLLQGASFCLCHFRCFAIIC